MITHRYIILAGLQFKTLFFLIVSCIFATSSCKNDDGTYIPVPDDPLAALNLPEIPFEYADIQFPDHYLNNPLPINPYRFQFATIESDNTPDSNPTTNEGALLGRVLFYEQKLSANGTLLRVLLAINKKVVFLMMKY